MIATQVIHGANDDQFFLNGATVKSVRAALVDAFNIPLSALAYIDGSEVDLGHRLRGGETLEFCVGWGRKGAWEPDELARIQAMENRLKQIESQLPTVASLTEAVVRVADHIAPPAANIVGSRYIADRLNCSTAWVSKMAITGMIPRKCVVSGTGNGRFWKFYRHHVDDWLATRASNGCA